MAMITHYSHAAPYIRRQIITEVLLSRDARLKRDSVRHFNVSYGMLRALDVLVLAGSTQGEPRGVADIEEVAPRDLAFAREKLEGYWDKLGFEEDK